MILTSRNNEAYSTPGLKRINSQWGKGFNKNLRKGGAVYLPDERTGGSLPNEGGSFLSAIGSIGNFISTNSNTIKNVGETIGSVVGAASSIANAGIGIAKNIEELRQKQRENEMLRKGLSEEAKQDVLNVEDSKHVKATKTVAARTGTRTGSGFKIIK